MSAKSDRALDEWLDTIDVLLDRLADFYLPDDFPFDYSATSLEHLEAEVLARSPHGGWQPGGDSAAFVESVMAYVGEALMRTGGGHWEFGPHPADPAVDVPYVHL